MAGLIRPTPRRKAPTERVGVGEFGAPLPLLPLWVTRASLGEARTSPCDSRSGAGARPSLNETEVRIGPGPAEARESAGRWTEGRRGEAVSLTIAGPSGLDRL